MFFSQRGAEFMVAIVPGAQAPDLTLKSISGETLQLGKVLKSDTLALLVFFKVSCPVCQFTFPYLERIHRSYRQIPLWGVSQDDLDASMSFAKAYGCSFPIILDEDLSLTVRYGLTNVPSLFLIDSSGKVQLTSVGFVRDDLEQINERLAEVTGAPLKPVFTSADEVPALRPG